MSEKKSISAARRLWVVVPCFHDSQSFLYLRRRLQSVVEGFLDGIELNFVVIDDSGGQDLELNEKCHLPGTILVSTPYNLGHQAALVFGLRKLSPLLRDDDFIVTMDSDGEDCPEHIPQLLEQLLSRADNVFKVALAQRTKRNESLSFKVMYALYKLLFRMLTGTVVRNGNFAAFRGWFARHVAFHPSFDLCYSSTLLALPLDRCGVPLPRGTRYYGESKMTFVSLVSHGFRMLLPFAEKIAIRAIIAAVCLSVVSATCAVIWSIQVAQGLVYSTIALIGAVGLLGLAVGVFATSCIFFQVFNQTRAIALRSLTAVSVPRTDSDSSDSPGNVSRSEVELLLT